MRPGADNCLHQKHLEDADVIGSSVSHYQILRKLGAGGMGEVYAAQDTHLARLVAIKFPWLPAEGADAAARFLNEARAASRLDHPNIAHVYDYGEAPDGRPFLVMELVSGKTLRRILRLDGALSPAVSVAVLEGIGRALREAHRTGLVHRDLKPANVMLTDAGEVKVLDFGLAKEIEDEPTGTGSQALTVAMGLTPPGGVAGTPEYMSPEQARGSQLDGRSDLFSAGLILYECLTGRKPFPGETGAAVLAKLVNFDVPPPSAAQPSIPAALDRITLKALARDAEARYQTAEELLADLAGAGVPRSGTASRSAGRAISGLAGSPRGRRWLGIAALAAAACAGGLIWRSRPHEPPAEAMQWYQKGAAALRDGTYYAAAKMLERAVAADPSFSLAHARLAEAWNELDDSGKAKSEMLLARGPGTSPASGSDALYADAILRTLTGDFPGAIRTYTDLLAKAPASEKPAVLVDLGRARERNGEGAKALEDYREAARRDPQNAAAHMRAGIILGRQKNAEAAPEFARAESLYQSLSNVEGQAEVLYQRGVLASPDPRRLVEARAALEKTLGLARAIGTSYQEIAATLQLSVVTFQEGDPAKAEGIASGAVERARRAGMAYLAARGLTDLGNAQFVKGDYSRAEASFRESLDLSQRSQMRRTEARALFSLASLHQSQGAAEAALTEIEPALAFFRAGGFRTEAMRCVFIKARATRDRGNDGEALASLGELITMARALNDAQQEALAEQATGSILLRQERWPDALSHYQRYYDIARSIQDRDGTGRALVSQAGVLWQMGSYFAAEKALTDAEALTGPQGRAAPLAAQIDLRRAAIALSRGNLAEAAAKARQVSEMSTAPASSRAEAKCLAGLAVTRNGSAGEGVRLCSEGVVAVAALNDQFALADARCALAEILSAAGKPKDAAPLVRQALQVYEAAGHKEAAWRAWAIAARVFRRAGESEASKDANQRAAAGLAELRSRWSRADFDRYFLRPDISILERELQK